MENQLNAEHVQTMLENIGFPAANAPQEEKDLFHALFVFELKNRQMALNTKKARIAEITQRVRTALAPTLHGIATVLGQQ